VYHRRKPTAAQPPEAGRPLTRNLAVEDIEAEKINWVPGTPYAIIAVIPVFNA